MQNDNKFTAKRGRPPRPGKKVQIRLTLQGEILPWMEHKAMVSGQPMGLAVNNALFELYRIELGRAYLEKELQAIGYPTINEIMAMGLPADENKDFEVIGRGTK